MLLMPRRSLKTRCHKQVNDDHSHHCGEPDEHREGLLGCGMAVHWRS